MKRRAFVRNSALVLAGVSTYSHSHGASHSPDRLIRVGVIGCGIRGQYLIKLFQENVDGTEVTACCDIYKPNLQGAMNLVPGSARGYEDWRAVVDSKQIDAVIIATPLHLHFEMASAAIASGKHVYCEKTMCYNIEQSRRLYALATISDVVFQVGYQQRANLLFNSIKDLIDNGSCGKITHVDCAWNRNGDWRRTINDPRLERLINWRMYREYSGGLMTELCSHQIDIVNYLLEGHPLKVSGFGGIDYWKDGRETFDNVNVIFEYPSGIKARFSSLTTNAHEGFYIKLYGTEATIEVNRRQGQSAYIHPERPPEPLSPQADAVTGATQPAWERHEGISIKVDGKTDDEAATSNALACFVASITEGAPICAGVRSAYFSSVSAHMANAAMYSGKTEVWRNEYDL